jgi:hypothetical protein
LVRSASFLVLAGRVEVGHRGQGSGGARPRRGRRALTATPFGACCSGRGDRKGLCCFRVCSVGVVVVFRAGFPGAGQANRAAGHSFATCGWHEAVRRDGRSGSIRGSDLAGFGGHDLHDPRRP